MKTVFYTIACAWMVINLVLAIHGDSLYREQVDIMKQVSRKVCPE